MVSVAVLVVRAHDIERRQLGRFRYEFCLVGERSHSGLNFQTVFGYRVANQIHDRKWKVKISSSLSVSCFRVQSRAKSLFTRNCARIAWANLLKKRIGVQILLNKRDVFIG